jgi:hypothetical protein
MSALCSFALAESMMAWAGHGNYREEGQAVCNMGRLLRDNQKIAPISAQALLPHKLCARNFSNTLPEPLH